MRLKFDTFLEIDYPANKLKIQSNLNDLADGVNKSSNTIPQMQEFSKKLNDFERKLKELEEKPTQSTEKIIEYEVIQKPIRKSTIKMKTIENNEQIYRKIEDIEKEIEGICDDSTSIKTKFNNIEDILKTILKEIEKINQECIKLENNQKDMQAKFIKCLRNKDMQNQLKQDKVKIEKLCGSDVEKLYKEMSEKNKRIVIIENNSKHLNTELEFLKKNLLYKFAELQKSLFSLQKSKVDQSLEFNHIKTNISLLENTLSDNLVKLTEEISPRKLAFGAIESEDKRMKRSYESIKGITEEFNQTLTPIMSKRVHSKFSDNTYNISPRISWKHKQ